MAIIKVCAGCGKEFPSPNNRNQTCGPECGYKFREAKREAARRMLEEKHSSQLREMGSKQPPVVADKKIGFTNWREFNAAIGQMQVLRHQASISQDRATIRLGDGKRPILLATLSDMHIGAWSSDHAALEQLTDEILNTDGLYVALLGDLAHMAIKLRGVLEVTDNLLPPELQLRYLESWLEEIAPKVAFATWDNHAVMREEAASGISAFKNALGERFVYCNGIGHIDVQVGEQVYRVAASHFFRGRSIENPCHGQMRYMRREGQDREIAMAGDSHVPGMVKYVDGDRTRIAVNAGSTQTNSGYAKRFFSITTHPIFPCVELYPDQHLMVPYWSVREWLTARMTTAS